MFGWEFPPFNSGGLGVACLGLTRALSQIGDDVIFVMPRKLDVHSPYATIRFADENGIPTYSVDSTVSSPYMTSKSSVFSRSSEQGFYGGNLMYEVARYASAGKRLAEQETFDIIYAHDWLSFGAGVEAKRATRKPLIVHVHATEVDRTGSITSANPDVYAIEREGMEVADVVIAVSEFTKNIIVEHYGIPRDKIRVVHNGIDDTTSPGSVAHILPRLRALKRSGASIVLFLGRVTLQKGPDYFLHAAARALAHNSNIYFILGGSGDMDQSMIDLTSELGIADHVLFTGFLQGAERAEAYAVADLFVMPSVSEPFGITSLEAMSAGTPILISKQSGVSEVVKHALKVDFWNTDDMANKILSVVGMEGLRASLAVNGEREAETLTWAQAAVKVDAIVRELLC